MTDSEQAREATVMQLRRVSAIRQDAQALARAWVLLDQPSDAVCQSVALFLLGSGYTPSTAVAVAREIVRGVVVQLNAEYGR